MFTHIVLFKFKDKDQGALSSARDRLLALKGKVPELLDIEVGIDELRSERSFDLALVTRFESLAAMQAYQVHPAHVAVTDFLKPLVEVAKAVDYTSQKA